MNKYWLEKNIKAEVKDVDDSKGIVTLYASRFGNIDSDGDKVISGAFVKTIHENFDRIKFLKNHNPNQMIGKPLEISEDAYGLLTVSKMSKNSHGADALIEYQEGLITEHSIGYNVIKSSNSDDQFQALTELKLFEFSAVTWGANPDTPLLGIKGIESKDEIQDELNHLLKYIKVAGLSDELYSSVEIKVKQLQQAINDLKNNPQEPSDRTDTIAGYGDNESAIVKNFIRTLKK